jgi:hypothetical protein
VAGGEHGENILVCAASVKFSCPDLSAALTFAP